MFSFQSGRIYYKVFWWKISLVKNIRQLKNFRRSYRLIFSSVKKNHQSM